MNNLKTLLVFYIYIYIYIYKAVFVKKNSTKTLTNLTKYQISFITLIHVPFGDINIVGAHTGNMWVF